MRVRISEIARDDLKDIRNYIAKDRPRTATRFVLELIEECEAIGPHPTMYAFYDPVIYGDLRRKTHRSYLIFYRVHRNHVEILRILHGARDVESVL